jgi:hypothetical protein
LCVKIYNILLKWIKEYLHKEKDNLYLLVERLNII